MARKQHRPVTACDVSARAAEMAIDSSATATIVAQIAKCGLRTIVAEFWRECSAAT
jgi:hypothetical protein